MSDENKKQTPEFFVSRRGRQVGVHEVDLSGIDVESESPASATPAKKADAPKPPKAEKITTSRTSRAPRSRKKLAIVSALVLAIIALPVIAGEIVAAEYAAGRSAATKDMQQLVAKDVLPLQKKGSLAADELHGIAEHVNAIVGRICRGGLLDNAAQLYPRAKDALAQCKDSQRSYAELASRLYELESQARYLERLDGIIKPVTAPITDEFAVISAQQSAWQDAADATKKLSPPTKLRAAHEEVLNHITAVAKAWSELNQANNAQDGEAFTAAEEQLSAQYQAIRETSGQFGAVINDSQARITAAYNSLQ
jgi:hypothetical protein